MLAARPARQAKVRSGRFVSGGEKGLACAAAPLLRLKGVRRRKTA
jgi:hypothetical protein